MKVKVLYFSSLKDRIKKSQEVIDIKEKTTVGEFIKILKERYPELEKNFDNVMIAVNEEYASSDQVLKEGDTVAIIPPVSGG
ncbi:MAG TPA: molybdopterin converting factor subunit 1 [Persephonella sp.]|uniref:Molybdopterin synthase sulfur carrier subunit n=1 Tax=Persephonella marina (strain DSM 14350 / EX-H1) TaxID=123214 RepID=C0QTD5_PERMH|nr:MULTISPECIES: molybdopterin converting factor subunit 1 [Persephonella]ACO04205.1 molybdopterin converting factor, subunit 1 [Persephonella marina EX-H1]HCB70431.1 molybdopterin converting factor subunit 1 [Persephonella sp.]